MKSYTKNKYNWLILAGLIAIISCNGVNDPQPEDLETIPEQVVDLLERKFPNAEKTTIKVVEKDRLWEASYSQNSQNYYVALDSSNVLATYRLISPDVPDSVKTALGKLAIQGGVPSDYRQNMDASVYWAVYEAKYVLGGTEYLLNWSPALGYAFTMNHFSKFVYEVSSIEKLPPNAKSLLRSENLSFSRGSGFVNKNNIQSYTVDAKDVFDSRFLFNSSGTLIFTEYDLQQVFVNKIDLPSQVLKSIQNNPLFEGFDFFSGAYNKNYKVTLKKGNESFTIYLDDNAAIISITYTGQ